MSKVSSMDKPTKVPRRKRDSSSSRNSDSSATITPNGVLAKKLPIIGPPVVFTEDQLKTAFALLDTNCDGKLDRDELKDMLTRLGFKDVISETLLTSLINDATRNGTDLITEEQFLEWMPKLGLTGDVVNCQPQRSISRDELKAEEEDAEKDLRAAFAVFDVDHNGFITKEELKEGMKLMGENMSEFDLDVLLNQTDVDKDGQINYEEFITMLL
ncbi:Calcium-binding protein E63-1 [Halotydeus destructor]|nr:Calcium-binding protein E63-1 [Halotydeus destructor]